MTDTVTLTDEIARARRMLFAGNLTITITSPLGGAIKFRFAPLLEKENGRRDALPWDGRGWWLFRGSEYVGIVKRSGSALELRTTGRSTKDRMFLKAANLTLDALSGVFHAGYELAAADRCGKCGKELTDPESIALGIGPVCRGDR